MQEEIVGKPNGLLEAFDAAEMAIDRLKLIADYLACAGVHSDVRAESAQAAAHILDEDAETIDLALTMLYEACRGESESERESD